MKTILHQYNSSLGLIDVVAAAMGGSVEGNFIKGDNDIYEGTHFFLSIEEGINALLIDTAYKEEVLLKYRNENTDIIGLYFYQANKDVNFILDTETNLIGEFNYNLTVLDSTINKDYTVQKGTQLFVICILLEKYALNKYFSKISRNQLIDNDVFKNKKNTIIRLDRMNFESIILINDFRKIRYDNPLYDVYFRGLVYRLIGSYVDQLKLQKTVATKTISEDVKKIIVSKAFLLNVIEEPFPGIFFLAKQAEMSPSKFKNLFAEISGVTAGTYFYNNKLNRAKELLETGRFTVNEVALKLNYANVSYLSKRFHDMYGVFPKEYQSLF